MSLRLHSRPGTPIRLTLPRGARRARLGRHLLLPLTSVLAGALCWLSAAEAQASSGSRLALDLDYAGGIKEDGVDPGIGGALRYGYKLDLLILSITPEVGANYYSFGGDFDPRLISGFVGGRLGFGKTLEPSVFVHLGYGSLKVLDESRGASTFDAGVALDLTVLPMIDLGIHAAYNAAMVKDADAFDWYRVGAHAAIAF